LTTSTFNHVVLSRTLQTVRHTERILGEMLRVGREAVVSFPNFAYWKNRMAVMAGRMPVSEDLPYEWFDTPNLRFFTILDFEALCAKMGLVIRERQVLDDAGPSREPELPRQPRRVPARPLRSGAAQLNPGFLPRLPAAGLPDRDYPYPRDWRGRQPCAGAFLPSWLSWQDLSGAFRTNNWVLPSGTSVGKRKRKQWRNCTAVPGRFSIAVAGSGSRRPARYSS
jgi:hypothetical protein